MKRHSDESLETLNKKSKTSSDSSEGCSSVVKTSQKRKSDETQNSNKTCKTSLDSSRGCSSVIKTSQERKSEDETLNRHISRAAFASKYKQKELLYSGGFGSVYEGYCNFDNTPVAIKYISQNDVQHIRIRLGCKYVKAPLEVGLLLKLKWAKRSNAVVELLDWYDLDEELILVLERPVPCMDLEDYVLDRGGSLCEKEAKVITKQLLDALIEIHSKNVFHRDIKPSNILIHTGSDVPHVKLIDFGCGALTKKDKIHSSYMGTPLYFPPELYQFDCYMAEPTTVWQLGTVVFEILHGSIPFKTEEELISKNVVIDKHLSADCRNFLRKCLSKRMHARPTLSALKKQTWLI